MSFSFSSPQVSPGPNPNMLYDAAKVAQAGQAYQSNQLHMQAQQLDLTAADHEQVGRLAAGLLNIKDPAARAQAYAQGVGVLQSQGLAKYAPPTLPDEQSLQMLVSQSLPVTDQYKLGIATPAGTTAAINAALTPRQPGYGGAAASGAAATPSAAIPARGTGGPGASASAPTEWLPYFEEASKETGIPVDLLLAQARQESSFNPNNVGTSGEIGLFQIMPSTARSPGPGMQGVDPASITGPDNVRNNILFGARYLKSKMGGGDPNNPAVQAAALHAYNGLGVGGDPNYVQHVFRYRPTLAPSDPNAAVTAYTPPATGAPTTTATAAPAGGGGTPGSYRVASTAPTAPPGSTAAPAQPGQPQPAPASAAAAPIPPPASFQANLPHASEVPTGANSQQYQEAMDLQRRAMILDAQPDPTGRLKTLAAGLRSQAALALQNDSVVNTQEGQLHTLTGKLDDPAKPLADYHETTPGSGIWVGGPGTEPRFQPPGRLVVGPDGTVWQTSTSGAHVLQPADPAAIAARKAAEAVGTGTGTDVAKQLPAMIAQARNAAQQEGQIDYASNQLREAAKGGVPTGYFSDALATAAAAAKSLGIDTSSLGVNPEAVGNMQTAQKTLSVIGGAIIRQALGPGSAITDGKVEQFIHTQPGIQNDPMALQRIMAWARSQYTYEREMGQAAVAEAAKNPTGTLPLNWQAQYYRDHGFAPIYDPVTQEMQQPDGRQPARETPASAPAQQTAPAATLPPKALSSLVEGHVTVFSNGQQWTLRNGKPVQVK